MGKGLEINIQKVKSKKRKRTQTIEKQKKKERKKEERKKEFSYLIQNSLSYLNFYINRMCRVQK